MSLDPQTREIDGAHYTYRPLATKAGRKLFAQLVQRFGGAFGDVAGDAASGGAQAALGGKAIGALCAQLDPAFYDQLADQLLERMTVALVEGQPAANVKEIAEAHLAGRIMLEIQLIEFALEAQFSDFLGFVKNALNSSSAAPALAKASASGSGSPPG